MASAFIKSLPDEAKVWFARAAAGVITADRKVTEGEISYLQGVIMFLENPEETQNIIALVKEKKQPQLGIFKTNRKVATRILVELIMVAVRDEKLSHSEAEYFIYAGGCLGFDAFFSREILDWGKEYCKLDKKRKVLVHRGETSTPYYKQYR